MSIHNVTTKTEQPPPDRDIDASTSLCLWLLCCPIVLGAEPYKTKIHLNPEEVTRTDVTIYGTNVKKMPYGDLGSVDRGNCLCCAYVMSEMGPLSPGCGCEYETVDDLVTELKARMRNRGDTGQIKRLELALEKMNTLEMKVDKILEHLQIPMPQTMGGDRNQQ